MNEDNRPRVLRGGSWVVNRGGARADARGNDHPDDRNDNDGFRVVCGSPILNTDLLNTDKEKTMYIDDIEFKTIPGGTILFRDKQIEVPEFQMQETLVTNGMWDEFLADDYDNPAWWDFEISPSDQKNVPGQWSDADCPRETINWYQAKAFGKYLSARLGVDCDLPTEEQFFYAASSGDPANIYPWGPQWRDGLCNTWESGIHRTSPVKQFPDGRTKHGIYDLAGNVWEWCRNEYEN